jgi:hypothetical protein
MEEHRERVLYNKTLKRVSMGLEINTNKTKLSIQSRRADKQIHSTTLMGETIEAVKDFVYLESNLSADAGEENEIQRRMVKQIECTLHCYPL